MNEKGYEQWKLIRKRGAIKFSLFWGFFIIGGLFALVMSVLLSLTLKNDYHIIILGALIVGLPMGFIFMLLVYLLNEIEYRGYSKKIQNEKTKS